MTSAEEGEVGIELLHTKLFFFLFKGRAANPRALRVEGPFLRSSSPASEGAGSV